MAEGVKSSEEAAQLIETQAVKKGGGLQDGMFVVWAKGTAFVLTVVYKHKVRDVSFLLLLAGSLLTAWF